MLWKLLIFVSTTKKCLKLGYRMCFEIYNTHTLYFISCKSFCHLHPQIAKARRGRQRGKVTAVITDNIIIVK